jgi:hypothetical protein
MVLCEKYALLCLVLVLSCVYLSGLCLALFGFLPRGLSDGGGGRG